jgi:hypothetical protein
MTAARLTQRGLELLKAAANPAAALARLEARQHFPGAKRRCNVDPPRRAKEGDLMGKRDTGDQSGQAERGRGTSCMYSKNCR